MLLSFNNEGFAFNGMIMLKFMGWNISTIQIIFILIQYIKKILDPKEGSFNMDFDKELLLKLSRHLYEIISMEDTIQSMMWNKLELILIFEGLNFNWKTIVLSQIFLGASKTKSNIFKLLR